MEWEFRQRVRKRKVTKALRSLHFDLNYKACPHSMAARPTEAHTNCFGVVWDPCCVCQTTPIYVYLGFLFGWSGWECVFRESFRKVYRSTRNTRRAWALLCGQTFSLDLPHFHTLYSFGFLFVAKWEPPYGWQESKKSKTFATDVRRGHSRKHAVRATLAAATTCTSMLPHNHTL